MPIAGYTTDVSVERTTQAIMRMLSKRKVLGLQLLYADGIATALIFRLETQYGARDYSLPVRIDGVRRALRRDGAAPRYLTHEHAARVAWRVAHDWLRAQLAILDAEMTTIDELMLPFMVTGDDGNGEPLTMYASYVERARGELER